MTSDSCIKNVHFLGLGCLRACWRERGLFGCEGGWRNTRQVIVTLSTYSLLQLLFENNVGREIGIWFLGVGRNRRLVIVT